MLVDGIIKRLSEIEPCSREEFESRVARAFEVYKKEKLNLAQKGTNLFVAYTDTSEAPVLYICVEHEDGRLRFVDAWN